MTKVGVIGSYNADLTAKAAHIPKPGETILGGGFSVNNGGKGSNQAVAAKKAGAELLFAAKLGQDAFGEKALSLYRSLGIDTSFIILSEKEATGAALIMVDENTAENCILVASGSNLSFTEEDAEKFRPLICACDYLLFQLEITPEINFSLMAYAHEQGKKVILNPAPASDIPEEIFRKLYLITPNEHEAAALTGVAISDMASAKKAAEVLLQKGVQNVIITLGSEGALLLTEEECIMLPAIPVKAVDTTGAGDAYNGALLAALAEGKTLPEAAEYAAYAAAISVTKPGAAEASPFKEEILSFIESRF